MHGSNPFFLPLPSPVNSGAGGGQYIVARHIDGKFLDGTHHCVHSSSELFCPGKIKEQKIEQHIILSSRPPYATAFFAGNGSHCNG